MNKMIIGVSVAIGIFLINSGLMLHRQTIQADAQKNMLLTENLVLSHEIKQEQSFKKNEPKTISQSFTIFVNETKMFETYSGTRMNIVLEGAKENENLEDHLVATAFRGVKALPLNIRVEKFSNETDMGEVLNDIFLLERRTDFKVSEISTEDNTLLAKGELYGI